MSENKTKIIKVDNFNLNLFGNVSMLDGSRFGLGYMLNYGYG